MARNVIETARTATHYFYVWTGEYSAPDAFIVDFRPLNPKTGQPWQASHRITHGADISPPNWGGRKVAYSTLKAARAAVARKQVEFAFKQTIR
jgi:hypothetical protein